MNNPHPNDRQLQRYLNSACFELESKRIKQHIYGCSNCRTRLHTYLNLELLLDDMPLMAPSSELEERIMRAIRTEPGTASSDSPIPSISRSRRWRPELINGMVATAATYLFVSTGILGKIMAINADQWGEDVQERVEMIGLAVHRLSIQLFS